MWVTTAGVELDTVRNVFPTAADVLALDEGTTAELVNKLGLPLGICLVLFAVVREMWKHTIERYKDSLERERDVWKQTTERYKDSLESERDVWKQTTERYKDALEREREIHIEDRDSIRQLQSELAALNASLRDRVVPVLEQATTVMAAELSRRGRRPAP